MASTLPKTMECLIQPREGQGPPEVDRERLLPEIKKDHEVLVRVSAVALNPTDFKLPRLVPAPGSIMGCDFMGTVIAAGPKAEIPVGTRVCGPMQGSNPWDLNGGAFAEYVKPESQFLIRVPDSWTDLEGAALGGVGRMTIAMAMEDCLHLRGTPSNPVPPMKDGSREPVLVFGGATASGTMACQLLSRSGYDPIAICSQNSMQMVQNYGPVLMLSSQSRHLGEDIKNVVKDSLGAAIDCITSPGSVHACFTALRDNDAKYVSLEYAHEEWRTRKNVQVDFPLAYAILGEEVKFPGPYYRPPSSTNFALGVKWTKEVQMLVDQGRLKCHPVQEIEGRWDGIRKGLEMLAIGAVHGHKLVVRIGDM